MKISVAIAEAVLTMSLFAIPAFARDHNVLNGIWTLVPAKSDFAGQPGGSDRHRDHPRPRASSLSSAASFMKAPPRRSSTMT